MLHTPASPCVARDLCKEVLSLGRLDPSAEVNDTLTRLVTFCLEARNQPTNNLIRDLKKEAPDCDINGVIERCLTAEYCMEVYWAKRIGNGEAKVDDFWYYKNYVDITDYETAALKSCGCDLGDGHPHKVAFIGSGPLPLSAFLLAQKYPNLGITMVDREAEAHELAINWMKLVDPAAADRINVLLQDFDVCTPATFEQFDVIYLGASVGSDEQRQTHISAKVVSLLRKNAWLAVRTVEGACGLLYHPFPLRLLHAAGLKNAQTFPAPASIVNNVHLGQKQGALVAARQA